MSEVETRFLPLLPLSTGVVLPQMVVPLGLESDEAKAAADAALAADGLLVLVPRIDAENAPTVYARVGTVAKIEEAGRLPGGGRGVLVRGLHRALLGAAMPGFGEGSAGNGLFVQADPVEDPAGAPTERAHELMKEYRAVVEAILEHRHARPLAEALRGIGDAGALADSAGYSPDLSFEQRIELLETVDVEERLAKAVAWARETLGELELKERIRSDVTDGMEKRQREFMLHQQMDAIRKELGESDGDVAAEYRAKIAEAAMPDAVREAVVREIDRLERTGEQSPEHSWIRTWLDTLTELPWGTRSEDRLDLVEARSILDADHTGLDDVKERIVEHLAIRKLRKERGLDVVESDGPSPARGGSGAILVLVGPPGVGKTSLGESVARALGRKFVRVALGGVRDEAEIRGHRRTYVGAQPGRFVRALKEAGTMNPVILLDEVDKLANDWRGDPTSALLEVLDPAQNHTFRDHYAEVDLDLSDVLFLATANVLDTIPGPLLDRMELLRLDGYTEDEKVTIALGHLLPRQQERNGLSPGEVEVTAAAVRQVVTGYTREAGVRGLERELGRLLRKAAVKIASSGAPEATRDDNSPILIDVDEVEKALGRAKFYDEAQDRTGVPGVATGLAVTGAGGDVLFVEAGAMPAESGGGLTITGQLGDVMKESAEIALSYVRSHAEALGLPAGSFERKRFHLHVPAGAVPKDGPSAGVTMTTALVSLLTGRPVKSTVGMTGEVTLSGRVLPIGGVKQKVLAAHRAGLTEVVLPARNGPDLDDVPAAVREVMTFHLAEDIGQVLGWALEEVEVPPWAGWRGSPGRGWRAGGGSAPPDPPAAAYRVGTVCGRAQVSRVPEIIEEFGPARVGDIVVDTLAEEVFPRSVLPGLVLHKGERVVSSFAWAFFEDGTGYNARLETAPDRPAWRDAYRSARLVLPLARFVEGRAWFSDPAHRSLAVAGLYRLGAPRRATMLTRPADGVVEPYHERMPVILPPDLIGPWLAGQAVPADRLLTESPPLLVEPLSRSGPPPPEQPTLL